MFCYSARNREMNFQFVFVKRLFSSFPYALYVMEVLSIEKENEKKKEKKELPTYIPFIYLVQFLSFMANNKQLSVIRKIWYSYFFFLSPFFFSLFFLHFYSSDDPRPVSPFSKPRRLSV